MRPTFYILDGTSLVYRAFYAIRNLASSKGLPTNAILGFTKILQKLIREKKPDYLVATFDAKGPTFRHKEFQDYKAQRKPMPDELVRQLSWIKDLVRAYRIPILEVPGFEADDLMGSLAQKVKSEFDVFIVSPDKDILQLVEPQVKVIPNPAEERILDEEEVKKLYGVSPKKIPDLLALAGDSSDNIPGVPGIGLKTASLLLQEVQDLDQLFREAWIQKGKIRKEDLIKSQEVACLSRNLTALRLDVPFEISLSSAQIQEPNQKELIKIFQELEFRDLLNEVVPTEHKDLQITLIQNLDAAHEMNHHVRASRKISLAVSAQGDHPLSSHLVALSVATTDRKVFYIPFDSKNPPPGILKDILNEPSISKIGYDLKRTELILKDHGMTLKGLGSDVMIASFLINPAIHHKNLQDLVAAFLSQSIPETDTLSPDTSAQEAIAILELEPILENLLEKSHQKDLFHQLELPLIEVLVDMEKTGIPLDSQQLQSRQKEFQNLLEDLEKVIYKLANESFNINSPRELSKILFEKLKLPPLKKTKTGYSTNAEVLSQLADRHEIIPSLLEYRQISKLKSTYVDSLPKLVNPKTGRLHTTFSQTTAETGRLASSNPNLQNIPIRTPLGKKIRAAFVAPPHTLLLSADYSQIELRVLAHLSEDKGLIQAFENDEDIHRWTAQAIFNVGPDNVTEAMRSKAKVINFGIVYGMGAYGLSKELGISIDEAQNFIDQYHQRFPRVQNFINDTLEKARAQGYVITLLGRRRYLPDLKSPQIQIRQLAERMAINTPIQGTAADLIKMAMIRLHHNLQASRLHAQLVLQIHDELILTVPKKELETVRSLVKDSMENIVPLKVKLKVDIHTGENWMEL